MRYPPHIPVDLTVIGKLRDLSVSYHSAQGRCSIVDPRMYIISTAIHIPLGFMYVP